MRAKIVSWIKTNYPGLVLGLLILLGYHSWLFGKGFLVAGDWQFHYKQLLAGFFSFPSMWESFSSLGSVDLISSFDPIKFIYGLLSQFVDYSYSERIVYFFPVLLFSYIGVLKLGKKLFSRNHIGTLFFGMLFLFNTYILSTQTGFVTYAAAYSLTPIILLFFIRMLDSETRSIYNVLLFTLSIWLAYIYEARAGIVLIYMLAIYFIFDYVFSSKGKRYLKILHGMSAAFLFILLSIFSIIPLKFLGSTGAPTTNSLFVAYNRLPDALSLHNYAWQGNPFKIFSLIPFNQTPVSFYFYITTFITFIVMLTLNNLLIDKRWKVVCFSLIGLIGIFFLKQQNAPFGEIYSYAFSNLPTFNLFRESNKFIVLLVPLSIVLGYSVINISKYRKYYVSSLVLTVLFLVLSINVLPLITGSIETLFTNRTIPSYYSSLKNTFENTPDGSRSLWVPNTSNWSYLDHNHPAISYGSLFGTNFSTIFSTTNHSVKTPNELQLLNSISQNYFKDIINQASIKNIYIPNTESDINEKPYVSVTKNSYENSLDKVKGLKKNQLDNGSYYTNESNKPFITTESTLYAFQNTNDLDTKYDFIKNTLHSDFTFTLNSGLPATEVNQVYSNLDKDNISNGVITTKLSGSGTLYKNPNQGELNFQVQNNVFQLQSNQDGYISGQETTSKNRQLITAPLDNSSSYILGVGSKPYAIDSTSIQTRTIGRSQFNPVLYKIADSIIPYQSSSAQQFRSKLEDCNNYDNNPSLYIKNYHTAQVGNYVELGASRHIACSSTTDYPLNDAPSELLVKFKYRAKQSNLVSYQVDYGTSKPDSFYVPADSSNWKDYATILSPPKNAKYVKITVQSAPNQNKPTEGIIDYGQLSINKLYEVGSTEDNAKAQYVPVAITGSSTLTYISPKVTGKNLLPNASFENGPWQSKVQDCNNRDNNAHIGMKIDNSASYAGKRSLELSAKTHIACTTSQAFDVHEGSDYTFNFAAESPNASQALYSINFNDPDGNSLKDQVVNLNGSDWQNFKETFTAPYGATRATVTLYAYSQDNSNATTINRYDDIYITQIPSISKDYFFVSGTSENILAPKITYSSINQTHKSAEVKNVSSSFYLNMSESYHSGWTLESNIDNKLVKDHYSLDTFANGWFVNTKSLCANSNVCTKNNDGTYNIKFNIIFTPQKYFTYGIVVSLITFITILSYIIVVKLNRKKISTKAYVVKK